MPETLVRGSPLSWSVEGQGPTAIYAHGLTSSRANDRGRIEWSGVVDAGHRLVTYDARGHGRSPGVPDPAHYEWPVLAQDFVALAHAVAPGEQVTGIGLSMGTATLIHAAVAAPELFSHLILAAVPTVWETRPNVAAIYDTVADAVELGGVAAYAEATETLPVPGVFADVPDAVVSPDVSDVNLPAVLRGAARSDLPPAPLVSSIDLPVLILAWTRDAGHPVTSAQRLLALIAHAQLVVAETPAEFRQWGRLAGDFISR